MWTYDDWGGWYDHVRPPQVDEHGYGFRCPALLVSPYARRGYVDSTTLDFTSILRFIEDNWGLAAARRRATRAPTASPARSTSRRPRARRAPRRRARAPSARPRVRRRVIYLATARRCVLGARPDRPGLRAAARAAGRRRAGAAVAARSSLASARRLRAAAAARAPRSRRVMQTVPAGRRACASRSTGTAFAARGRTARADRRRPRARRAERRCARSTPRRAAASRARLRPLVRAAGCIVALDLLLTASRPRFVDLEGTAGRPGRGRRRSTLQRQPRQPRTLQGRRPRWLQGSRVVPGERRAGRSKRSRYAVAARCVVDGLERREPGQQRFLPARAAGRAGPAAALLRALHDRDASSASRSARPSRLTYPDGASAGRRSAERRADRAARCRAATTGQRRRARVSRSSRPVALSRNQEVELEVISWLDIGRRCCWCSASRRARPCCCPAPPRRAAWRRRPPGERDRAHRLGDACALVAGLACGRGSRPGAARGRPDPLFAYYYIWFNPTSWNRAKIDYPLLGRYSSDERDVMRQHIEWAKQAGIDGFIVSWKSTPALNRRLRAARRGRRGGALQAAGHLPGPRLRARAAAGRAGGQRPRLLRAPLRAAQAVRRLRASRS